MEFPLLNPGIKRLVRYIVPYKWLVAGAVLCMVIAGASSSLIALLLGKLTDLGFYEQVAWVVMAAPIGLIAIALCHGSSMFLSNYLLGKASQNVLYTLRAQMFNNMLHWPAATYARNGSAAIASKFVLEANVALSNATKSCITLVRDSCQVVALVIVLVWHNWQLAIVSLILAPLIWWLLRGIFGRMKKVMEACQESITSILVHVKEVYQGHRLIKLSDTYEQEKSTFQNINDDVEKMMVDMSKVLSASAPLTQLVSMIAVAGVLAFAMYQTHVGMLTLGEFVTFLAALLLLMPPLRNLTEVNAGFILVGVACESLFATIDETLEEDNGTQELNSCQGAIRFEKVSLRYPGKDIDAVQDFNLTINPGDCVAVVGLSGAGKTSLINLLPRFWNPTAGRIEIDGKDIQNVKLESLRKAIAIVSQDARLFDDTIRNNLTYGVENATDEDIQKAIKAASIEGFIASLPEGLETQVGEAGSRLSGGQKQRLSIARAFLKNAPILILDEPTSALDRGNEEKIKEALKDLMKGRTTIIVAHRFSTIENANVIVAMENGRIKEMGSRGALLEADGLFAHLYRLQQPQLAAQEGGAA